MENFVLKLGVLALAVHVHGQTTSPPSLALDWGTWQSQVDPSNSQIYTWSNVRFADQPPRFGPPSFPKGQNPNSTIDACIQVKLTQEAAQLPGIHVPHEDIPQGEDCLGLDIYAPVDNFDSSTGKPKEKLPVVVWFYGGAYLFGSKRLINGTPLYSGQSILAASGYKAIFVAGNYRLGALGWLAGHYMETMTKQDPDNVQTNAGLYDQALLLKFVSQFIDRVGGDASKISVWGESAGASSILHHLVRDGGKTDPLFRSFVVQSPAFQWSWDNSDGGRMDSTYQSFSTAAGCGSTFDMACLKKASVDNITAANQAIFQQTWANMQFPVGPSVDGGWIQTLPTLAFTGSEGSYWPNITSAIISHTGNEAHSFTPKAKTRQDVINYLINFFPGSDLNDVRNNITNQYLKSCGGGGDDDGNSDSDTSIFASCYEIALNQIIRDSSFTCNTRLLHDAYPSARRWLMAYNFPWANTSYHAGDLAPLYMNNVSDAVAMIHSVAGEIPMPLVTIFAKNIAKRIQPTYQAYMGAFAANGDPNSPVAAAATKTTAMATVSVPSWTTAAPGPTFSNVMDVSEFSWSNDSMDDQNTNGICDFWVKIAEMLTKTRGLRTEAGFGGKEEL